MSNLLFDQNFKASENKIIFNQDSAETKQKICSVIDPIKNALQNMLSFPNARNIEQVRQLLDLLNEFQEKITNIGNASNQSKIKF